MSLHRLDTQELNTILAALRFYHENEQGEPANRSDEIHEIATAGDQISLDQDGINQLCNKLKDNPDLSTPEERDAAIEKYCHGSDDMIEVDDDALVSRGDTGLWVQAWVYLRHADGEA